MLYYHVRIRKNGQAKWVYAFDLTKEQLMNEIVSPFLKGQQFMCEKSVVRPTEIDEIGINETELSSSAILKTTKARLRIMSSGLFGTNPSPHPPKVEAIISAGKDVTRELIKDVSSSQEIKAFKPNKRQVFIVHGTDYYPVNELKAILEEAGLKPIVLHEQPSKGMTIIEKLEKYSDVGFTFIILTPDDFGVDKKEIRKIVGSFIGKENCSLEDYRNWIKTHSKAGLIDEVMASLKERARQNVVLEFGYFMGRLSREKICCLYKGDIELPSDMQGICYVHFNRSVNEVKSMILNELKEAGYEIRG